MKCNEIEFGTYKCTYTIKLPYKVTSPWKDNSKLTDKYVEIDKCLIKEIIYLWEQGIKTTGCCCGHGNNKLAYIGVKPEYIQQMKDNGYKVYFNPCRPNDEDSFVPKTILKYGEIKKGVD